MADTDAQYLSRLKQFLKHFAKYTVTMILPGNGGGGGGPPHPGGGGGAGGGGGGGSALSGSNNEVLIVSLFGLFCKRLKKLTKLIENLIKPGSHDEISKSASSRFDTYQYFFQLGLQFRGSKLIICSFLLKLD